MSWKGKIILIVIVLCFSLACTLSGGGEAAPEPIPVPTTILVETTEPVIPVSPTASSDVQLPETGSTQPAAITHLVFPGSPLSMSALNYDVESNGTAPERRAPYGDSYNLNILERPFGQDMTYIPEIDIRTFGLTADDTWYYLSIELIGSDLNNGSGAYYGVVLDTDKDGYGDYLIWATPPYPSEWSVDNVLIYADTDQNSAGRSPIKSDAPFDGVGYDSLLYYGGQGIGDDVDLAWVRLGKERVLQFAFKKQLAGTQFLFGAMADAGLKDISRLDYVDHLTKQQAGSPVRDDADYPLKELYAVDTTCLAAFGFISTGYEPKVCPPIIQATKKPSSSGGGEPGATQDPNVCQPPPGGCPADAPNWWPDPHCACSTQPFNP